MSWLKQAIEKIKDVGSSKRQCNTRLLQVTLMGSVAHIRSSLQSGADINYQNESTGLTALLIAVQRNNIECVDYLVSQRADGRIKDINGSTALMFSIACFNHDIFTTLTFCHYM